MTNVDNKIKIKWIQKIRLETEDYELLYYYAFEFVQYAAVICSSDINQFMCKNIENSLFCIGHQQFKVFINTNTVDFCYNEAGSYDRYTFNNSLAMLQPKKPYFILTRGLMQR